MKFLLFRFFAGSIFLLLPEFSCVSQIAHQPAQHAVVIPMGGNAYITSKNDDATERMGKDGIEKWTGTSTVYSAFFRISKPGKTSLFLKYNVSSDSEIKLTCHQSSFNVSLHKGVNQTAYAGTVMLADTGYIRVDLQGLKRSGDEFGSIAALIVDGEPTGGTIHFVHVDFSFYWGRRGPSVHLSYPFPEGVDIEWFYNELTVPVDGGPIGTYYMANGFGEGYFGIQINSPVERRVLFSVWSPYTTDNPGDIPEDQRVVLLKKGENVHTGEFGNEGSGGQSYLKYPWITGNTYKFLTRIRPDGKGATEYTAWFFAPELGKWRLIAQFRRPKTNTWYKRAHSFLESFNPETGYMSRKCFYGNQWACTIDGRWIELAAARFTADETARKQARMDYKGGTTNGKFLLQNCGFLNDYTTIGSAFSRPTMGIQPDIDREQLP